MRNRVLLLKGLRDVCPIVLYSLYPIHTAIRIISHVAPSKAPVPASAFPGGITEPRIYRSLSALWRQPPNSTSHQLLLQQQNATARPRIQLSVKRLQTADVGCGSSAVLHLKLVCYLMFFSNLLLNSNSTDACYHTVHGVSEKKQATLIFTITSAKVDKFSYFSLLHSESICRGSLELKLTPPLESVSAVPCEN